MFSYGRGSEAFPFNYALETKKKPPGFPFTWYQNKSTRWFYTGKTYGTGRIQHVSKRKLLSSKKEGKMKQDPQNETSVEVEKRIKFFKKQNSVAS